jgi:hypothetical protein
LSASAATETPPTINPGQVFAVELTEALATVLNVVSEEPAVGGWPSSLEELTSSPEELAVGGWPSSLEELAIA